MFLEEYPHEVTVARTERIVDNTVYPTINSETTTEHGLKAFLDTPTTSERLTYHNLNVTLDRNLYAPFGADILRTDVIFYGDEQYEIVGDGEDQGGQHEVWKFALQRVNANG